MIERFATFLASIVENNGPSVTRWVYMRTTEAITFGWCLIVGCATFRLLRYGTIDAGVIALITSLALLLLTASALNQNTKLTLDAKTNTSPSSVTTPTGTVTQGVTNVQDNFVESQSK